MVSLRATRIHIAGAGPLQFIWRQLCATLRAGSIGSRGDRLRRGNRGRLLPVVQCLGSLAFDRVHLLSGAMAFAVAPNVVFAAVALAELGPCSFTQVSAGWEHACGLRPDGSVECWGHNGYGRATPPGGSFTQVSAGWVLTCGLRPDGSVVCWGRGQVALPEGSFTQASAGGLHTCGLRPDGSVECRGYLFWTPICTQTNAPTATPTPTPTDTPTSTPTYTPTPTPTLSCDDGNPCTVDHWDGAQCVHVPAADSTPCDDGNVCTVNDQCLSGICQAGGFAVAGTSCDDGLFCNGTDTCDGSGTCQHSGNPCVGGPECNQTCNEAQDNCFDPAGTPCSDDGLVCTADACNGSGTCAHTALPPAQCPKGYVLLEAPSSATATARLERDGQALGAACAESAKLLRSAQIAGHAVAQVSAGLGLSLNRQATVGGTCVTGGGAISLAASAQCGSGQGVPGEFGQVLSDCIGAADLADGRRGALMALPADRTFGAVTAASDTTLNVSGFGAVPVIDYQSLVVKPNKTLTIQGGAGTQAVVVRVAGDLRVERGAKIVGAGMSGAPGSRILILVGSEAFLRRTSRVEGTVYAQGKVRAGWGTAVEGALVSKTGVEVGRSAVVKHAPWVLW